MCEREAIPQLDHKKFKKVNSFEENSFNKICVSKNILQDISHLRRVLNYNDIDESHILSFCNDNKD